ncbi:hypothetical protein HY504_03560 [Candidatus Wolfebacteria bacterium]|nr:hypothetical protein [Candidatus Wolfebacteria bacterium]
MRGGAAHFAPPHPSRALRGEGRIPFELFQEYTAASFSLSYSCLRQAEVNGRYAESKYGYPYGLPYEFKLGFCDYEFTV